MNWLRVTLDELIPTKVSERKQVLHDAERYHSRLTELHDARWRLMERNGVEPTAAEIWKEVGYMNA